MKRFVLILFIIGTCLVYLSCSTDNPAAPETSFSNESSDPLITTCVTDFSGTSTNIGVIDPGQTVVTASGKIKIRGLIVQTEDILSDPRVTGVVTWVVNLNRYPDGTDERWGSGELILPNGGKWVMTYEGWKTPEDGVTYEVDGHGKNVLLGLTAHWTYLKPIGAPAFTVNGYIMECN